MAQAPVQGGGGFGGAISQDELDALLGKTHSFSTSGMPAGYVFDTITGQQYRLGNNGIKVPVSTDEVAGAAAREQAASAAANFHGFAPQAAQHFIDSRTGHVMIALPSGEVRDTGIVGAYPSIDPQVTAAQTQRNWVLAHQLGVDTLAQTTQNDAAARAIEQFRIDSANVNAANDRLQTAQTEGNRIAELAREADLRAAVDQWSTSMNLIPQLGRLSLDESAQVAKILNSGGDFLARAFASRGGKSPLAPVLQADQINALSDTLATLRSMVAAAGAPARGTAAAGGPPPAVGFLPLPQRPAPPPPPSGVTAPAPSGVPAPAAVNIPASGGVESGGGLPTVATSSSTDPAQIMADLNRYLGGGFPSSASAGLPNAAPTSGFYPVGRGAVDANEAPQGTAPLAAPSTASSGFYPQGRGQIDVAEAPSSPSRIDRFFDTGGRGSFIGDVATPLVGSVADRLGALAGGVGGLFGVGGGGGAGPVAERVGNALGDLRDALYGGGDKPGDTQDTNWWSGPVGRGQVGEAHGGFTTAPRFRVGEPRGGHPNAEQVFNPTNAPLAVAPEMDMKKKLRGFAMGTGMPTMMDTRRHARPASDMTWVPGGMAEQRQMPGFATGTVTQQGLVSMAQQNSPPAVSAMFGGRPVPSFTALPSTVNPNSFLSPFTQRALGGLTQEEVQALGTRSNTEFNAPLTYLMDQAQRLSTPSGVRPQGFLGAAGL